MPKYKCCICKREFSDYGNNPKPICNDENARCCDDCNSKVVIPERLKDIHSFISGGLDKGMKARVNLK